MKPALLDLLACPRCGADLDLAADITVDGPDPGGEVVEGTLACDRGHTYLLLGGIPHLLDHDEAEGHVADSFGFEWGRFHHGSFESDTVFGLTVEQDRASFYEGLGVKPEDMGGAVVLDAGCGSGRLTVDLARQHPDATVVALDINPAIGHVYDASRDLPNLHVVRGSALAPPLRAGSVDLLWSNGVIHHTGHTREAFAALATTTRPGGRAYVWVYEAKPSPLVAVRRLLRPLRPHDWDHRVLYGLCWILSVPTWLMVKAMALVRASHRVRDDVRLRVLTRDRGLRELVLTWFDVLSPRYRDTYTEDEITAWFEQQGFGELDRYWWPVGVAGTRLR
jgi:SAM-dependent methyltransferase